MRSRAPLRGAGGAALGPAPLTVSVMPFLLSSSLKYNNRGVRGIRFVGVFLAVRRELLARQQHARRPDVGVAGSQRGDLGLEVGQALEGAVDAREPQVGDLVELPERLENG